MEYDGVEYSYQNKSGDISNHSKECNAYGVESWRQVRRKDYRGGKDGHIEEICKEITIRQNMKQHQEYYGSRRDHGKNYRETQINMVQARLTNIGCQKQFGSRSYQRGERRKDLGEHGEAKLGGL